MTPAALPRPSGRPVSASVRASALACGAAVVAFAAGAGVPGTAASPAPGAAGGFPGGTPAGSEATEAGGQDARAILRRAERRYRELSSLRATFRESVRVPLLERERSGRGTWYQKGRSLFKLDYHEPPDDVVVSDGTHVWTYYPSSQPGQVTRTALERSDRGREMVDLMGRIFREARSGYSARHAGRETVAGVETHHVVLEPTGDAPYREVRLWIGVGDRLVRRFQVTEENRTVRTVTLSDLEPNAAVPDSVFHFEVPEGAEVFSG